MTLGIDEKGALDFRFLEKTAKFTGLLSSLLILVALSVDIGMFYGIDISYFTFFTLSEHILFTLEFIPQALFEAFLVLTWLYLLILTIGHKIEKTWIIFYVICTTYIFFIVSLFCVAMYKDMIQFSLGFFGLASAAILFPSLSFAMLYRSSESKDNSVSNIESRKLVSVIFVFGVVLIIPFLYGTFIGGRYFGNIPANWQTNEVVTREFGDIHGRVIRAGSSGVLLFDLDKREILFIKWDGITMIALHKKV